MTTEKPISGSCLCGRVEFEVTGPFPEFNLCHCERCRKATGTGHCTHIVCLPPQLKWISGQNEITLYKAPHYEDYPRAFCKTCGSLVPRFARDGVRIMIPAGTLEGDPKIRPTRNIFWSVKADWDSCQHNLPTFDERPVKK